MRDGLILKVSLTFLAITVAVCISSGSVWGLSGDEQTKTGGQTLDADGAQAKALARFSELHPRARFYWTGHRITRLYGTALGTGDSPEETAEQFRLDHARMFGVDPDDLKPVSLLADKRHTLPLMFDRETGEDKFTMIYYSQYASDIPVFRAELRLMVRNMGGFPLVWAAPALRELGAFTPPPVDSALKFDPARQADTTMARFTQPETVIWAGIGEDNVEPVLAVTFIGEKGSLENSDFEKWLFVADARTGEILFQETRIIFEDVSGNVSGMATEGPKADMCAPEVATAMPFADVSIDGGNSANADLNGDFTIPHGGTFQVTVRSPMSGLFFFVDSLHSSGEETLSELVVPPGPVNFMHNEANTSEYVRAQVNAYIQANVVREFTLSQNPFYPVIPSQFNFRVNVNRTDGVCPGNAWYDGSSINFCQAASGFPNTAWSSVVYHEYAHHMVDTGGSGQGQYGEGMGDGVSVLILDDPVVGWGFFGSCSTGLRNADNSHQYPCSGEIHECGNLISGCIWSTRNQLIVTEPDNYLDILSSLTVNSILMHTGSNITPQITIDFLMLDDDDANINNGTPHYSEIDAGFSAHNMDAPPLSLLSFSYPDGRPESVTPQQTTTVRVEISSVEADPQPGTGMLHYSINGSSYVHEAMTEISSNIYDAVLPAADCPSTIKWYVNAETTGGTEVTDPSDAPSVTYTVQAADSFVAVLDDDFETNLGWTVENVNLTGGAWERGTPAGAGDRGDPTVDYDGSGQCFLTDNVAGNSDVDGGPTRLISPTFDLNGLEATISYARWFYNDDGNDVMDVQISNDGGSNWLTVETVGPGGAGGWEENNFSVTDYIATTTNMKLRFQVADNPNDSVTEAAVDAVRITSVSCDSPVIPNVTVSISSSMTQVPRNSNFVFSVQVTNNEATAQTLKVWTAAQRTSGGAMFEPLRGPVTITLSPGETRTYNNVPQTIGSIPLVTYRYWARIGEDVPTPLWSEDYVDFEVIP